MLSDACNLLQASLGYIQVLCGCAFGITSDIGYCPHAKARRMHEFFLFGTTADKVPGLREERSRGYFQPSQDFLATTEYIKRGIFGDFEGLMSTLEGNEGYGRADWFLLGYDFDGYVGAQRRVDAMYKDQKKWIRASIISTANSSKFSSDRSIAEYAEEMWGLKPMPVP